MFDSIRIRLTMGYVGILALILLLFGAVAVVWFQRQVTDQQDKVLLQRMEVEKEKFLDGSNQYGVVQATTDYDVAVVALPSGGSASVSFLDLTSSPQSLGLPYVEMAQAARQEKHRVFGTAEGPRGDVRVVSEPLFDNSGNGEVVAVIQAAQSLKMARETIWELVFVLVPVGIGALTLATVGGLLMSRRAIRPVRRSFERQRTFIADASHELKTPLTLIRADAEVLSRGLEDEDDRELVEDILQETDRTNAILSDLLVLARLDAGKLEVAQKPFDLAVILAGAADRFEARAAGEGIRLETGVDGELPTRGDPERTEQILAALLDNAIRFTPHGGSIAVVGRRDGNTVVATVEDTGPGVPDAHLPRIFDRFYRADEARTRGPHGGGTGLGLAISRDLARAQGGELTAENVPGEGAGARFILTLPASP
ncbi:hypothetical protein GBA65_15725 [Rubrobacter marinus]|uniref:histidine kinase n=1 Tax=Rubrobacter marinus TaxID=2653852 RepID=A0A6G8PZU7_9ACTN|nr:HAMP domain-containing sensor histidine kinase [Rubrobacter marinus]QIN79741.1 hypothetical protein GBA65_15725 [Rubrobacter marinus]